MEYGDEERFRKDDALEILKQRLAKGEITADEFRQTREILAAQ